MILNLIKIFLILWIISVAVTWYKRLSQQSRERFSPPPPPPPPQGANAPPDDITVNRIEDAEFEEVEKKS